jgi:hypothetical protein
MDRYLRVIGSMRTTPKQPGPWILTRAEVALLREAKRLGVTPRGLAQFARSVATGQGVKQSEASISLAGPKSWRTLRAMNHFEMLGKAGGESFHQKEGLREIQAQAEENRRALAALAPSKASSAMGMLGKAAASDSLRKFDHIVGSL